MKTLDEAVRRVVSKLVPNAFYLALARLYNGVICSCKMGLREYCRLKKVQAAPRSKQTHEFKLAKLDYPVLVRPGTTDALVMESNLIREAWGCYVPQFDVSFIMDAGANVGYSCIYFLNTYKNAQIYGIEPSPANFELALKNIKPYGNRVTLFNAAIWPSQTPLRLELSDRADGIQVVPISGDEVSDICGINPLSLLEQSGYEKINIFKCDIEDGERWLFAENCDCWLDKTDCILIEIHSSQAYKAVYNATSRHSFSSSQYRNTHVFFRECHLR